MEQIFSRGALLLATVFFTLSSFAGIDEKRQSTGGLGNQAFSVTDAFTLTNVYDNTYEYNSVKNYVILEYKHDAVSVFTEAFDVTVDVSINMTDLGSNVSTLPLQTLSLHIDPASGAIENDLHAYKFSNAQEFTFTVAAINVTSASGTLTWTDIKNNFYIDGGIIMDRFLPLGTGNPWPDLTNFSTSHVGNEDRFEFAWPLVVGAEEYQLEWMWVSDKTPAFVDAKYADINGDNVVDNKDILVDFSKNATRISTKKTLHSIPDIYPSGILVWRVRAMGHITAVDYLVPTDWCYDNGVHNTAFDFITDIDLSNMFYLTSAHESGMNWDYTISFAEEGKSKMVLNYYDGTLKGRQSLTRQQNADLTTVIVGESVYDQLGRATVTPLPVPVNSLSLDYRPDFTLNSTGDPFSYNDFATVSGGGCFPTGSAMSDQSGAGKYYSDQNTDFPNHIHQDLIPKSNGFPYSQTVLSNDHLGRVLAQGGVGQTHSIGSGHETRYYYGHPKQPILDALFGSNAGLSRYYEETMVIDPNGQASVSIKDLRGNTVATYLDGTEQAGNLSDLPGQSSTSVTIPLENESQKSPEGKTEFATDYIRSLTIDEPFLVSETKDYDFTYTFEPQQFIDACPSPGPQLCFDCVYQLEIEIFDECHALVWSNSTNNLLTTIGTHNDQATPGIQPVQTIGPFTLQLNQGRYIVKKTLSLSRQSYVSYLQAYFEQKTCLEDFNDFLDPNDVLNCDDEPIDCDYCNEVLEGLTPGSDEHGFLSAYCSKLCEPQVMCETGFGMMLADVSIGGQYAQFNTVYTTTLTGETKTYNTDGIEYTILKEDNLLPGQVLSIGGVKKYFNQMDWKHPIDGGYFDESGNRITVKIDGKEFEPQELTMDLFVENWDPIWAHTLVKFHPEYNYYVWCSEVYIEEAKNYKRDALNIDDFSLANAAGYLDPLEMSPLPTGIASSTTPTPNNQDPFFQSATGWDGDQYKTDLVNKFNNYHAYWDGSTISYLNIWEFCALAVGDLTPQQAANYDFSSNPFTCDMDEVWQVFRALYLKERDAVTHQMQDAYACDHDACNACIGEMPDGNWWFDHGLGIWVNSYQPCGIAFRDGQAYSERLIDKDRRFPSLAYAARKMGVEANASLEEKLDQINTRYDEMTTETCDNGCRDNVELWMQELAGCLEQVPTEEWNSTGATYNAVKAKLLTLCKDGCNPKNPRGALSDGTKSVNDILEEEGLTVKTDCNELLLTGTFYGEKDPGIAVQEPEVIDACGCNKVFAAQEELDDRIANNAQYEGTLFEVFVELYGIGINDIEHAYCECEEAFALTDNTCWDETAEWNADAISDLAESEAWVSPVLNCTECISCNGFNRMYYALQAEYQDPNALTNIEADPEFTTVMTRYMNALTGQNWTYDEYFEFLEKCGTITPLVEGRDAHEATGCNVLSDHGSELQLLAQKVFTHLTADPLKPKESLAFQKVILDLSTANFMNLSLTDFDDILPSGVDRVAIELAKGWSNSQVIITLDGWYFNTTASAYEWVNFATLYLTLDESTSSSGAGIIPIDKVDELEGYTATYQSGTITTKFDYTTGLLRSTHFDFEVSFNNSGVTETLTFSGYNPFYQISNCLSPTVLVDPLSPDGPDRITQWRNYSNPEEDCFCDNITDGFVEWEASNAGKSMEDYLLSEDSPPVTSLVEAQQILDYLNYYCCHDPNYNETYYWTFFNGGECDDLDPAFVGAGNSHGTAMDEMFEKIRAKYRNCGGYGDGKSIIGEGPSIPCEVIVEQLEGVIGAHGSYNTAELNDYLSSMLETDAGVFGSNNYTAFTDPCEDCPRPGLMLCTESVEQPDYEKLLDVLLTKTHTSEKVYKKTMNAQLDFDTYLKPEFDIFGSTLNRSTTNNFTNIRYKKLSESTTELKMELTYDYNTANEHTDIITLSTCCTTLDFTTINNVLRIEPAEVNNELMFYLYVEVGTCGVVRLKGTSTLFAMNTCCEIGSDVCFDKPEEPEQCVSQPTRDALAKAAKLYAQYLKQIEAEFEDAYYTQCFAKRDEMSYTYLDKSHHYMLYYYDQANNLTMTVPPEGVVKLGPAQLQNLTDYRNDPNTGSQEYPTHTLITHYEYNATGQPVEQTTPDAGTSTFYYDDLGRVVASQNAKQAANSTTNPASHIYSYTVYDELGRPTEAGEKTGTIVLTSEIAATDDPLAAVELADWYADGTPKEVTYTVYSEPKNFTATPDDDDIKNAFGPEGQQNLIHRVVSTYFSEEGNPDVRDFATHYSYDANGNVHTLVQEINELKAFDHHFKKIEYNYDLVSGNTHEVWYQRGKADQFVHRHEYDVENRLIKAKTSEDGIFWETDAVYQYYLHGPLARTTLGQLEVQGIDYAYTLQGWLKSVNSDYLQPEFEPGQDGYNLGSHTKVARDAMGFSLGYFDGDYVNKASITGSPTFLSLNNGSVGNSLYNGNIKHMVTAIQPFMSQHSGSPLMQVYGYDQLNRIVSSVGHVDMNATTRSWTGTTAGTAWQTAFTYDANGNIKTLKRYGDGAGGTNYLMDDLSYSYTSGTNQLNQVSDAVGNGNLYDTDIDGLNNYTYDEIGNLKSDVNNDIQTINWTAYGKVKEVLRVGSTNPKLAFEYSAGGNRTIKRVEGGDYYKHTYEYYVRDAGGNVMATYTLAADKDYDENFMNYEDFNAELISQEGLADFSTFIQDEFATDPVFKTQLKNQLVSNDNTRELYDQYTLSDLFTLSNLFYEDALEAYVPMDLANLILAQGKTQSIADLYQCDATKFIEALLLEDAAAFITAIDNVNAGITTSLCITHFGGGGCTNGPAVDLATVNAATLAANISGQPSNDIKTAIGQLANSVIANAIANHTISTWLADQIILCGNTTTYQGYLNTDALNAKNHLINAMGYGAILQRILDNDAAGMIDKVINLGHAYDYVSNALANTNTLTMSAYHTLVANHANYGQTVLDNVISNMQDMVTDYSLALKLNEHHLYGSARLGVQRRDLALWQLNFTGSFTDGLYVYTNTSGSEPDDPAELDEENFKRRRGSKRYELSNHLGNVLAVISDRRISVDDNSNSLWDFYEADMASAQDYYPFGMQVVGRVYTNTSFTAKYRFGFNGMERQDEWKGDGNEYHTTFRQYNPRLGRWSSIDPLAKAMPGETGYSFSNNMPVIGSDPDGDICIPCIPFAIFMFGAATPVNAPTGQASDDVAMANAYALQNMFVFVGFAPSSWYRPMLGNFAVSHYITAYTMDGPYSFHGTLMEQDVWDFLPFQKLNIAGSIVGPALVDMKVSAFHSGRSDGNVLMLGMDKPWELGMGEIALGSAFGLFGSATRNFGMHLEDGLERATLNRQGAKRAGYYLQETLGGTSAAVRRSMISEADRLFFYSRQLRYTQASFKRAIVLNEAAGSTYPMSTAYLIRQWQIRYIPRITTFDEPKEGTKFNLNVPDELLNSWQSIPKSSPTYLVPNSGG